MDILLSLAFSTHLGLTGTYNEIHPHVRLQEDNYIVGVYYNSEKTASFYVGKTYDFGKLDLEIGVVTGYSAIGDIAPMARATYVLSEDHKFYVSPVAEKQNRDYNYGVVVGLEFTLK